MAPGRSYLGHRPSVPEALEPNANSMLAMGDLKDLQKRHQADQRMIIRLQQRRRRMDKALAKAAALLMASKKIQDYSGEERED